MELIRYWNIVFKRWWLTAGLVIVVAILSALTYTPPAPMYVASFRFNVGLYPMPRSDAQYIENPLDVWQASEYFMDDLASAVRNVEYARRVAERLGEPGVNLAGAISASTEHRVLSVSITWHDPDQLARIADAAVNVLKEQAGELVGPLGTAVPVLPLIAPPHVAPIGRSLKDKLDIPIRLGLAVVVGMAGAFLLDYLDTTLHDRSQVEVLGLTVLAEIPPYRQRKTGM